MERPSTTCYLLDVLPPEIRLPIYEYLFEEPCYASLFIRNDSKLEVIAQAKAHAALIKTCRTLRDEASPVLYNLAIFRVQIFPVEGCSGHGGLNAFNLAPPFLPHIRHLQVKVCVLAPQDVKSATSLMKTFALAVDSAHADVRTLEVVSNFRIRWDRFDVLSDDPQSILERFRKEWRMV